MNSRPIRKTRNWIAFALFALAAILISKPKTTDKQMASEIERRIKTLTGQKDIIFLLMDEWYRLPTLESVKEFFNEDKTDLEKYLPTIFDCDNFAIKAWGAIQIPGWSDIAYGLMAGLHRHPSATKPGSYVDTPHAANIFVTKNDIYYHEPQTDMIKPLTKEEWPEVWVVAMA